MTWDLDLWEAFIKRYVWIGSSGPNTYHQGVNTRPGDPTPWVTPLAKFTYIAQHPTLFAPFPNPSPPPPTPNGAMETTFNKGGTTWVLVVPWGCPKGAWECAKLAPWGPTNVHKPLDRGTPLVQRQQTPNPHTHGMLGGGNKCCPKVWLGCIQGPNIVGTSGTSGTTLAKGPNLAWAKGGKGVLGGSSSRD